MNIKYLILGTLVFGVPAIAYAVNGTPLPEPESLALVGIGAIALVIARWAKRK